MYTKSKKTNNHLLSGQDINYDGVARRGWSLQFYEFWHATLAPIYWLTRVVGCALGCPWRFCCCCCSFCFCRFFRAGVFAVVTACLMSMVWCSSRQSMHLSLLEIFVRGAPFCTYDILSRQQQFRRGCEHSERFQQSTWAAEDSVSAFFFVLVSNCRVLQFFRFFNLLFLCGF